MAFNVHPAKLQRVGALLKPASKSGKRGPKGEGTGDTIVTPEQRAWQSYKMRREQLFQEYMLPTSGNTDGGK